MIGGPQRTNKRERWALVTKLNFHQKILLFGWWLIIAAAAAATHHSFSGLFICFFFDRVDPCVFDVLVPSAAALIDDVIRSCSQQKQAHKGLLLLLSGASVCY